MNQISKIIIVSLIVIAIVVVVGNVMYYAMTYKSDNAPLDTSLGAPQNLNVEINDPLIQIVNIACIPNNDDDEYTSAFQVSSSITQDDVPVIIQVADRTGIVSELPRTIDVKADTTSVYRLNFNTADGPPVVISCNTILGPD